MQPSSATCLSVTKLFIDPTLASCGLLRAIVQQIGFACVDKVSDADVYVGSEPPGDLLAWSPGSGFGVDGRIATFDLGRIAALGRYRRTARRVVHGDRNFTIQADAESKNDILCRCARTLFTLLLSNHRDVRFLWWFPEGARGVVNYRVDVDDGTENSLGAVSESLRKHGGWCSIYYCTSHFAADPAIIADTGRAGAEVGSHCHYHYTFERDPATNGKNIRASVEFLRGLGIEMGGLAMPSGKSFAGIGSVLRDNDIAYTSNFGFLFDALPLEVCHGNTPHLEVPIHPVAPGNVIKAADSLAGVDDYVHAYYLATAGHLSAAFLPVFLYGHNNDTMHLTLLPGLLDRLAATLPDHVFLRLDRYAAFWRRRLGRLADWRRPDDGTGVAVIGHDAPDAVRVAGPTGERRWPLDLETLLVSPLHFAGAGTPKPRLRDRLADRYELEMVLPLSALALNSGQGWKSAGYKITRGLLRRLLR